VENQRREHDVGNGLTQIKLFIASGFGVSIVHDLARCGYRQVKT
jgi:hypothetical protein